MRETVNNKVFIKLLIFALGLSLSSIDGGYCSELINYTEDKTGSDYTYSVTDKDGNTHYYKVNLNHSKMSTNSDIKFEKSGSAAQAPVWNDETKSATGTIEIVLPHNNNPENPKKTYYTYSTQIQDKVYSDTKENITKDLGTTSGTVTGLNLYVNPTSVGSESESILIKDNKTLVNFVNTSKYDKDVNLQKGAINNDNNEVDLINADFINNSSELTAATTAPDISGASTRTTTYIFGGAINNFTNGTINQVIGNFINNSTKGDAYNNKATCVDIISNGSVIFNNGNIESIIGNFINNSASSYTDGVGIYYNRSYARGAAIYNIKHIGNIVGDFIGNKVISESLNDGTSTMGYSINYGGAIHNSGTINSITGNFIDNHSITKTNADTDNYGGALYSNILIESIDSNFINNSLVSTTPASAKLKGGALYFEQGYKYNNESNIRGSFINNNATIYVVDDIPNACYGTGVDAMGGAAYIESKHVDSITSDFINNYINIDSNLHNINSNAYRGLGGAIYNDMAAINTLTGNFISNYVNINEINIGSYAATSNIARGGAVYNDTTSTIQSINGDFINNSVNINAVSNDSVKKATATVQGGAIYNLYGDLNGSEGAYYTDSTGINLITGNFINNYASAKVSNGGAAVVNAIGGAIYNFGNGTFVGTVTGDFLNNYATAFAIGTDKSTSSAIAQGGAIYNGRSETYYNYMSEIDTLNSNFVGNHVDACFVDLDSLSTTGTAYGGAVYNGIGAIIGSINGDFVGNYAKAGITDALVDTKSGNAEGGAIYNDGAGNIGDINGNFVGNFAKSSGSSYGGAISNRLGNMKYLIGDFVNNFAEGDTIAQGGAIYSTGTISGTNGDFVNNYAISNGQSAGGAIYSQYVNYDIVSNFINNYASGSESARGGALYNLNTTKNITGDFLNNYVISNNDSSGGAIHNMSNILTIDGNFTGNHADGMLSAAGGAIYNKGKIDGLNSGINGTFSNNYVNINAQNAPSLKKAKGGAIYNDSGSSIGIITGDFIENSVNVTSTTDIADANGNINASGGAIHNEGTLSRIIGNFAGNSVKATSTNDFDTVKGNVKAHGGAIYNTGNILGTSPTGKKVYTVYIEEYVLENETTGETISVWEDLGDIDTKIENAIAKGKKIRIIKEEPWVFTVDEDEWQEIINGSGDWEGVVTTEPVVNVSYENLWRPEGGLVNTQFIGNSAIAKSNTPNAKVSALGGAIYTTSDLSIVADGSVDLNNGNVVFKDNYTLNNDVKDDNAIYVASSNAALTLEQKNGGNIYLYDNIRGIDGYKVNIAGDKSGTVHMLNDIHNANVLLSNININTINNNAHTYNFNSLNVNGAINMTADVDLANNKMDHFEANNNYTIADNASITVSQLNLFNDSHLESQSILFAEEDLAPIVSSPVKEAYSPLYKYNISYSVGGDKKGYFNFARDFNPAVKSSPVLTQTGLKAAMNATMGYAFQHADMFSKFHSIDRFAMINENKYALDNSTPASTDFNTNLSGLNYSEVNKGLWLKPYAVFERIPLKNGPEVDSISYGSVVGYDSNFKELRKGWYGVTTGYLGYNGAHLSYDDVTTTMNGGILGGTQTWYKGNFWTALTLMGGASVSESDTMYGHEENTSIMAGIGSKSGYNFELASGKLILQPIWFMNYSFMKTFDYTNAAGLKIDSAPLHTIQLNPSFRVIGNLKHGWQPYASVGMVWNLMNTTNVHAAGVKLPEMSVRPYVEYGLGIQKQVGDRFTGFTQAMVRNGGRNGVALTFGFRWALGKGQK